MSNSNFHLALTFPLNRNLAYLFTSKHPTVAYTSHSTVISAASFMISYFPKMCPITVEG